MKAEKIVEDYGMELNEQVLTEEEQAELAHLKMLAERAGVSLDVLRPKLKS